jgi:hypothetical protein
MLFFNRILKPGPAPKDLRGSSRYAIGQGFPLAAVLNIVGRDEHGQPLQSRDGNGWDWKGRLVNFSSSGASMQLPLGVSASKGDRCSLILSLDSYRLKIPGHIAHLRHRPDSVVYGLKLDYADAATSKAYHQLIELVALGASLKPEKSGSDRADKSGYIVEHYGGERESHLTIWRGAPGREINWFELQMTDYCVRGNAQTGTLEFLAGKQAAKAAPLTPARSEEVHRLFRWVVPNIARSVPADVRNSLLQFAA